MSSCLLFFVCVYVCIRECTVHEFVSALHACVLSLLHVLASEGTEATKVKKKQKKKTRGKKRSKISHTLASAGT